MKGFGSNDRKIKKSEDLKFTTAQKDKLISNAFSFHSSGRIKQASEIYNYLIKNRYFDPRVFNNLGTIYLLIKDFDRAIILFEESIKRFPTSLEPYSYLANVLLKKGNNESAKKYLEKAIEIDPKYLRAYSNLASIYVGEGNFESAKLFLKRTIEINPNDINSLINLS